MEFITICIVLSIAYWLFKEGKRLGSRGGFRAGLRRRRWRR